MREIVGVVGKTGSGKSTIARMIGEKHQNCIVLDLDKIGHKALEQPQVIEKLCNELGNEILDKSGKIDRTKLREVVFSCEENLKKLESTVWQYIDEEIDEVLENASGTVVLESIKGMYLKSWDRCTTKILVFADDEERKSKVMERDNISEETFNKRNSASPDYSPYEFDYIIKNLYREGNLEAATQFVCNDLEIKERGIIRVTVLGTQSPYAEGEHNCPGFLIQDGKNNILLDCGSGTHKMVKFPYILKDLHIIVTHLHGDHYNDIVHYQFNSFVFKRQGRIQDPINIYTPSSPSGKVSEVLSEKNAHAEYSIINEERKMKIGDMNISFCKVDHPYETYAVKIEQNGKIIVYTSDMSFSSKDEIVKFAKGADLLIAESSLLAEHGFPEINSHLTARQAAIIAKEAEVKKLKLTHLWPEEEVSKYLAEAKEFFPNVVIAKEGDVIDFDVMNREIKEERAEKERED